MREGRAVSAGGDEKARREYAELDARVVGECGENWQAYLVGFFSRKAKADGGSLVHVVVSALVVNLSWQFVSGFASSAVSGGGIPADFLFSLKVFGLAVEFSFLAASVALILVFYGSDRRRKAQILLEEHILRSRGYIGQRLEQADPPYAGDASFSVAEPS